MSCWDLRHGRRGAICRKHVVWFVVEGMTIELSTRARFASRDVVDRVCDIAGMVRDAFKVPEN